MTRKRGGMTPGAAIMVAVVAALLGGGYLYANRITLTPAQRAVFADYYSGDDLRACRVRVESLELSDHISGTFGGVYDEHGPSLSFLDERSPAEARFPDGTTPVISKRPPCFTDLTATCQPEGPFKADGIGAFPKRKNIRGWIVKGHDRCADILGVRSDRFILIIDDGVPAK